MHCKGVYGQLYVNGLRLPTPRERQAFFSYMRRYRDRIPITSFERLPFQVHRVGNPARGLIWPPLVSQGVRSLRSQIGLA